MNVKNVSPKVKAATLWSSITGLVLTVVVAGIGAITPDLFGFLGAWQGVAYAAVIAGGAFLGGYLKRDPLRDLGIETANELEESTENL